MTAVEPSGIQPPYTPAWRRLRSYRWDQRLLRGVSVAGVVLGHPAPSLWSDPTESHFSYRSCKTLYAALVPSVFVAARFVLLSDVGDDIVNSSWDTATLVAETAPMFLDTIFFCLLATFTIVKAPLLATVIRTTHALASDTPSASVLGQVISLLAWLLLVITTSVKCFTFIYQYSAPWYCGGHLLPAIYAVTEVFMRIYMTWLLALYVQILLLLRVRVQHLKLCMKEVLVPEMQGCWSQLNAQNIEDVIDQHRDISQQAAQLCNVMSPALLILIASYFINLLFDLHTFFTNMVFVMPILDALPLMEMSYLLSYTFLVLVVCCTTSSLSDQWCLVGQEVTGVPMCSVTEQVRGQLLTFLRHLPDLAPVTTAAGFFTVSKSFLLGMLNCVVTYLIFTMQFYDTHKQERKYGYFIHGNQGCNSSVLQFVNASTVY